MSIGLLLASQYRGEIVCGVLTPVKIAMITIGLFTMFTLIFDVVSFAGLSMQKKKPKVAICVVGSLRSFIVPAVRESLRTRFIESIADERDREVFFDVSLGNFNMNGQPNAVNITEEDTRRFFARYVRFARFS